MGRPALAGRLLELTTADSGEAASPGDDPEPDRAPRTAVSSLLVRSAALPLAQRREVGPDVTFGWASQLDATDVLSLGRAVQHQLATGGKADLGKAFGLAWDDGARIPVDEREGLMRDFIALQEAIGSALAGRDLREPAPAPSAQGLSAVFDRWVRGVRPERSPAAAKVEEHGEPGRLGLIAAWNAWAALRYRPLVPAATFERLVQPWTTVVGPLDASDVTSPSSVAGRMSP
jgi:hypothetical protein